MTKFVITFAIAFFGVARQAHAFCQPGDVQTCFVNGVQGTRTCQNNSQFGPCEVAFHLRSSQNTVDATSEDLDKTTSSTISCPAPAAEGINHDQDQIWLWLGPTVDMTFPTSSTLGDSLTEVASQPR